MKRVVRLEVKIIFVQVIFLFIQSRNNAVLEPRTEHFRGLVDFKAKDLSFEAKGQGHQNVLQHLDVLRGRLLGSHVNFHWQLGGQNNHQPCSSNDISHCSSSQFKHRAGQRCFELLALIGSPQLSFQRYSQLNKHLGLTGKPYWLAERQMVSR